MSILRLIPEPPGKIESGEIWYRDVDLLKLPRRQMRKYRGNEISMIFQEPMTSLNPFLTIRRQLIPALIEFLQQLLLLLIQLIPWHALGVGLGPDRNAPPA